MNRVRDVLFLIPQSPLLSFFVAQRKGNENEQKSKSKALFFGGGPSPEHTSQDVYKKTTNVVQKSTRPHWKAGIYFIFFETKKINVQYLEYFIFKEDSVLFIGLYLNASKHAISILFTALYKRPDVPHAWSLLSKHVIRRHSDGFDPIKTDGEVSHRLGAPHQPSTRRHWSKKGGRTKYKVLN